MLSEKPTCWCSCHSGMWPVGGSSAWREDCTRLDTGNLSVGEGVHCTPAQTRLCMPGHSVIWEMVSREAVKGAPPTRSCGSHL